MKKSCYILSVIMFGLHFSVSAQLNFADSLAHKINLYGLSNAKPVLFLHFDKTVYSNNESVWFTAYLLNAADQRLYNTVSIALVNDLDRTIVLEDRFVMNNATSFGKTTIPDDIPPGNYTFIATTNRLANNIPEVVFTQHILIKAAEEQDFNATLSAIDTALNLPQQKLQVAVTLNETSPPPKSARPVEFELSYYVGNQLKPVIKGFGKTEGRKYDFAIPSKILKSGSNTFHLQVWYKGKVKELSMQLPARRLMPHINFYPEGGNLVNGIQSQVGWEIKNTDGSAVKATGYLYQNNKVIDTISTNGSGIGKFNLNPIKGAIYNVKIEGLKDTLYNLPLPITKAPVLFLTHALANDTLNIIIKSNTPQKVFLIGHNYDDVYFTTELNLQPGTKKVTAILTNVPKGLGQLTLADSVGRPLAERLFFAHYNQRARVTLSTNQQEYHTRQPVSVKLNLNSSKSDSAWVSVACVQQNRIETKNFNNIECYFYLNTNLSNVPVRESYLGGTTDDKEFMETLLLVKGWRRYTWTDVLKTTPTDTIKKYSTVAFKGRITFLDKPVNKPVVLANIFDARKTITTDNTGRFTLNNDDLKTDTVKTINFMVSNADFKDYGIYLPDPYTIINEKLAGQLEQSEKTIPQNTTYLSLPANEHATVLKEVKIKGKNDNSFFGTRGNPNQQSQDMLRVDGTVKNTDGSFTKVATIYKNPDKKKQYLLLINGIYQHMELYNDTDLSAPGEPQYKSTLFWKHQLKLATDAQTNITFNTGDITGSFKIIVQGITRNDVTYGETAFNVTKSTN